MKIDPLRNFYRTNEGNEKMVAILCEGFSLNWRQAGRSNSEHGVYAPFPADTNSHPLFLHCIVRTSCWHSSFFQRDEPDAVGFTCSVIMAFQSALRGESVVTGWDAAKCSAVPQHLLSRCFPSLVVGRPVHHSAVEPRSPSKAP